jgi:hypothetical protein
MDDRDGGFADRRDVAVSADEDRVVRVSALRHVTLAGLRSGNPCTISQHPHRCAVFLVQSAESRRPASHLRQYQNSACFSPCQLVFWTLQRPWVIRTFAAPLSKA